MNNLDAPLYETELFHLTENLQLLVRHHLRHKEGREIDTYGTNWLLIVTNIKKEGSLGLNRFGKQLTFHGPTAIFLPPHSLIEWSFTPGYYHWIAYRSDQQSDTFPKEPVAFPWKSSYRISCFHDIVHLFSSSPSLTPVGKQENFSTKAKSIKELIDQTFQDERSIKELARRQNLTNSEMSRIFKRCYSLTPLEYRNKLRVFYSLKLMMIDQNKITDSALESGFEEISSFQRNFKKTFGLPPSSFLSKNDQFSPFEQQEVCSLSQEDLYNEITP